MVNRTPVDDGSASEAIDPAQESPRGSGIEGGVADVALEVSDLSVSYEAGGETVDAVRGVSFSIRRGEVIGIVGESGSGKSSLLLGLARLLPRDEATVTGAVRLGGVDLLGLSERRLRALRGAALAVVYQSALDSLNPVLRVRTQIEEVLHAHGISRRDARVRAAQMLREVGIPEPEQRGKMYPHQLSGGMRQRVLIASALVMNPGVLLADEPTAALDPTIKAQILQLIKRLVHELGTSAVVVSHDLRVVAALSDQIAVMYGGRIVEIGPAADVLGSPKHPYTKALLASIPDDEDATARGVDDAQARSRFAFIPGATPDPKRLGASCSFAPRCALAKDRCRTELPLLTRVSGVDAACHFLEEAAGHRNRFFTSAVTDAAPAPARSGSRETLLRLDDVRKVYTVGSKMGGDRRIIPAVDGVSLHLAQGETLGIVGESGCGKSSLGRLIVGLEAPTSGSVVFDGVDVSQFKGARLRTFRRQAQMIYQDARGSLNRSLPIGDAIREPLTNLPISRTEADERVSRAMDLVHLPVSKVGSLPRELSGGQAQRVAIARALVLQPRMIVADEASASLDVSMQGQILNLLCDLRDELGIALVFISHDTPLVHELADRVAVMYLGQVVESGAVEQVFERTQHPYTAALRSAIPPLDPVELRRHEFVQLRGEAPDVAAPPAGCRFHPRCPVYTAAPGDRGICASTAPALIERIPGTGVVASCHFAEEVAS